MRQSIAEILQEWHPTLSGIYLHGFHPFLRRKRSSLVGGIGITSRRLATLEEDLPGSRRLLAEAAGKVVFLGNGFSSAPIYLSSRHEKRELTSPPIIVDLFNYHLACQDYARLKAAFEQNRRQFPQKLEWPLSNLLSITKAIDAGHLTAVEYLVGSGNPPEEIRDASLVINCFGPNRYSLEEQCQILAPGGILHTYFGTFKRTSASYSEIEVA
ncbi:hypothetical protein J4210_05340 [Candidatus Woesearchaeota archaeon]|nr:hypothetical protein [Candidatus Woesearchaeota archaeon]